MCEPASMIATKNKMFWSEKTDSHAEIIKEFNLHESGARGINVVPVEINPPGGNLSLPLKKWIFKLDFAGTKRELPEWWDEQKYEAMCRAELKKWAAVKLKGWRVKEAFNPVNPLKIERDETLDLRKLLREWASVRSSVRSSVGSSVRSSVWSSTWSSVGSSTWSSVRSNVGSSVEPSVWSSIESSVISSVESSIGSSVWSSVESSVGSSVRSSVGSSVGSSVRSSVWSSIGSSVWSSIESSVRSSVESSVWLSTWSSVYGYMGSLFPNIKQWKGTTRKNPWRSIRKLWLGGYVPSFDGETWRLHAGPKAKVVFKITAEELRKG